MNSFCFWRWWRTIHHSKSTYENWLLGAQSCRLTYVPQDVDWQPVWRARKENMPKPRTRVFARRLYWLLWHKFSIETAADGSLAAYATTISWVLLVVCDLAPSCWNTNDGCVPSLYWGLKLVFPHPESASFDQWETTRTETTETNIEERQLNTPSREESNYWS